MCIIIVCEKGRLKKEDAIKAAGINKDGCGVAWRQNGKVVWQKGLELKDLFKFIDRLPLPYIVHFRIATVGEICRELTHPFPIDPASTVSPAGTTDGSVLFHNGTITNYEIELFKLLREGSIFIDHVQSKLSDSRAAAMISAVHGLKALDRVYGNQKFCVFSPTEITLYGDFYQDTARPGLKMSNNMLGGCSLIYKHKPFENNYSGYNGMKWDPQIQAFRKMTEAELEEEDYYDNLYKEGQIEGQKILNLNKLITAN